MKTSGPTFHAVKLRPRFGNAIAFHWTGMANDKRDAYETARRHCGYAHKALLAATGLAPCDADPALTACADITADPSHPWRQKMLESEKATSWRLGGAIAKLAGADRTPIVRDFDPSFQRGLAQALVATDETLATDGRHHGGHASAIWNGLGKAPHGKGFTASATAAPDDENPMGRPSNDPHSVPVMLVLAMAIEFSGRPSCIAGLEVPPPSATLAAAWRSTRIERSRTTLDRAAEILSRIGTEDLAEGVRKRLQAS